MSSRKAFPLQMSQVFLERAPQRPAATGVNPVDGLVAEGPSSGPFRKLALARDSIHPARGGQELARRSRCRCGNGSRAIRSEIREDIFPADRSWQAPVSPVLSWVIVSCAEARLRRAPRPRQLSLPRVPRFRDLVFRDSQVLSGRGFAPASARTARAGCTSIG